MNQLTTSNPALDSVVPVVADIAATVDPLNDQKEQILEKKVSFWTKIATAAVSLLQITFSLFRK